MLKYTVKNVAFYKNFKYVTLQDFPIVSKKIINENYEKFLVPPTNIPGQKGELHIQKNFRIYRNPIFDSSRHKMSS